jgi:hypothetical protein
MAEITSNEGFDSELLDPEVADQLEPLLDWLTENMAIILDTLRGQIGDKNMSSQYVKVKANTGLRGTYKVDGPVSNVQVVQIVSQVDAGILCTGFNWWLTEGGFDYIVTFTGTKLDREVILKVEFNL